MPWKINSRGVFDYHEHDPERIEEVDPPSMVVFGVKIESRCGQAREMIIMLRFVNMLLGRQPETVLAMDSVFWDSKGCSATITMGCTTPAGWRRHAAEQVAQTFWFAGGCHNLFVATADGACWEFESPEPDLIEMEGDAP